MCGSVSQPTPCTILTPHRKHEWLPWPIDVLVKQENEQSQNGSVDSAFPPPTDAADASADEPTAAFTHRVTEMAFGAGLGRVARVGWGDRVANVHTAAVPPWMVQSEDEYKRCNERQAVVSEKPQPVPSYDPQAAVVASAAVVRRTKPTAADATWLPNFGGVWQEGSRAQTKHEFKRTLPLASSSSASASSSSSSALQFRPSTVYQRRRHVRPAALRVVASPSQEMETPGEAVQSVASPLNSAQRQSEELPVAPATPIAVTTPVVRLWLALAVVCSGLWARN